MIDLCVINYNTRALLERLLDTLHSDIDTVPKSWELHIADNGSSDDTVDWLVQNGANYKITNAVSNENIGYSAACNQLALNSSSDIIALLNADVWFTSNDIFHINKIFEDNPDIHILGPKQRDENGFITHAGIVGSNVKPAHRGWRQHDPDDLLYRDRIDCVTISGSAYFIRREVWNSMTNNPQYRELYPDAIGAFLPTPHYYEETWCSYFARHLGYRLVYDGSVSIGHSWHASSPKPGQGYSEADSKFPISREIFRKACDYIGIERD
jgi:glycosyltransferase involved in cell wall biosynthesis